MRKEVNEKNWQEFLCTFDCTNVEGKNKIEKGEFVMIDCWDGDIQSPQYYGEYIEVKDKGFYLKSFMVYTTEIDYEQDVFIPERDFPFWREYFNGIK